MKKQILLLALLLPMAATFAKTTMTGTQIIYREMRLSNEFQKLVTTGNVNVVLYEDTSKLISIQGEQKNADAVRITEKDGVLTISGNYRTGKAVVYLPVKNLEMIECGGTSKVSSGTVLNCRLLTIVVNDYSKINVRSIGEVVIKEDENTDVWIEKKVTLYTRPLNS